MNVQSYRPGLVSAIADRYPRLDAVSALTEGTAAEYREAMVSAAGSCASRTRLHRTRGNGRRSTRRSWWRPDR